MKLNLSTYQKTIVFIVFTLLVSVLSANIQVASAKETKKYSDDLSALADAGMRNDREGNYKSAIQSYQKASSLGHMGATYNLARMYYQGRGVKQDDGKAKELVSLSCKQGLEYACTTLKDWKPYKPNTKSN